MKRILLVIIIVLSSVYLWAGGQKDPESSSDSGIEDSNAGEDPASLLDMAGSGDADGIEHLLKVDIDLNETDSSGKTALHVAAESGNAEIVSILLIRGADIDVQDKRGRTALILAVYGAKSEVVKVLSSAAADISIQDDSNNSPASLILGESPDLLDSLLTDENINLQVIDGMPLLHAAARSGLYKQLEILLSNAADINILDKSGNTALDDALTSPVGVNQIKCAAVLIIEGSQPPQNEEWKYIVEPLRSGNLEFRFDYGLTALHIAAEKGHEGFIRYLLSNGADIDSRDQPGNTALHVAVRKGYRTIAALLLDNGSDVNARDYNGNAPIHESLTANDNFAITTMLLDRAADPNIKNSSGSTPLHMTVLLRTEASGVKMLLDRGADIDPRDRAGNTPLLLAVDNTDRELSELFLSENADIFARNNIGLTPAEIVLSYGADVSLWFFTGSLLNKTDNEGRSVLHLAVAIDADPETLKVLLNAGSSPNLRDSKGDTALHYAVTHSNLPLAVTLLKTKADPFLENNEGMTALIQAFDKGPEFTLEFLSGYLDLEDRWGNTPLFHAVHWEYPVIVEAMLSAGADPRHNNRQGSTVLHEAVHTGLVEITSMLLKAGADPNAGNDMGQTAFHDAVSWGAFDILQLLYRSGALINTVDNSGQAALHLSAFSGDNEITQWLLNSGASADLRDNNGQTALFLAVESNRVETSRLLINSGVSLQMRDNSGGTVLHTAIGRSNTAVSQFLINSGSDIFAVDGRGSTPFDLAMEGGPLFLSDLMNRNLINRQDNMGNTPLHLAVISGADEEIITVLLEKGADLRARNAMGKTPFDLARDKDDEVMELLIR